MKVGYGNGYSGAKPAPTLKLLLLALRNVMLLRRASPFISFRSESSKERTVGAASETKDVQRMICCLTLWLLNCVNPTARLSPRSRLRV